MKRRTFIKGTVATTALSASVASSAIAKTAYMKEKGIIVHSVYFWLKKGLTAEEQQDFLQFFKGTGCFLEHLTCAPIDKSSVKIRKNQRQGGIEQLAHKIRTYQPRLIMILMKSIEQEVKESIDLSGSSFIEEIAVTCYPAGTESNRLTCIRDTRVIISKLASILT